LYLWNEGALTAIGNNIGNFIMVDKKNLESAQRKVTKVLVEMDVHLGMPETMEVEWHGFYHQQRLDYLGLPLRCNFCRSTSHLRKDCNGIREEEKFSDEQEFPYSILDSSMDTGFYGFEGSRVDWINKIFWSQPTLLLVSCKCFVLLFSIPFPFWSVIRLALLFG